MSKASELHELSAREVAARVTAGELRSETCTEQALERYRMQRDLNAVIRIDETKVLEAARQVDLRRARGEQLGLLAGVPLVIKDSIDVAGMPTTAATPALAGHVAKRSAPAIERLLVHGAVILGKANMHELALGATSSNLATGIVRNPYDRSRIAGGSSGGTAAAIAARIVPAGLGSDTAGSVRIPASFCGTAALRPTTCGRRPYPDAGIVPLARSLDTIGPMARTLADVALLHRAMADASASTPVVLHDVRLGVPRRHYWEYLESDVATVAERALERLREAGVVLVEVDVRGYFALASEVYMTLIMKGLKEDLRAWLEEGGHDFDTVLAQVASADVRAMFQRAAATSVPDAQIAKAHALAREKVLPVYRELFRQHGLAGLVFPTAPIVAPRVREQGDLLDDVIEIEGTPFNAVRTLIRNTHVTAAIGAPGLSLPACLTARGLPVGLELDGLPGEDDALLDVGIAVEQALGRLPAPARASAAPGSE